MSHRLRLILYFVLVFASMPLAVSAQDSMPPAPYAYRQLPDPAQERAARSLMDELRCLVCQGQSIADSDASLAGDMRHLVRSRIAAGESPEQVRRWLVARYGSWVTYNPPARGAGLVLWLAPLLLIGIALAIAARRFVRSSRPQDSAGASDA